MSRLIVLAGLTASLFVPSQVRSQERDDWQPAPAPLLTRWAADVSPHAVHPEYPRPQLVRPRWLNLNGLWQFAPAEAEQAPPLDRDLDQRILVPFPVESALSGIGQQHERVWYRRTFRVPDEWRGQRLLLHFGAVDWEARVVVNGRHVGTHRGGYDPFTFDITAALRVGEEQELVVGVFDPTDDGNQPHGKQVKKPRGIYYTPTTGIWQTVWLEPVPAASIESLRLVPRVAEAHLQITSLGRGSIGDHQIEAVAFDGDTEVGRVRGPVGKALQLPVPQPKLWSPDDPHLYDLRVRLFEGDRPIDEVTSYFGMREVGLVQGEQGAQLALNGEAVFQVGPLDQGFWPDGLYTAPTDEALRFDVEITKQLGFNMTRKHVKVEPARWYYWCDKHGLLVWQDMPHGHKASRDPQQFELELRRMIESLHHHPSIVMWVIFNEGWGQHDTERLTAWAKEFDPSRLISSASGWHDKGVGDVVDMHAYPGPGMPAVESNRAAVLGEFGGLGLPVPEHAWVEKTWSYRDMADSHQLTLGYVSLLEETWRLHRESGLSAAVYTQLTDVEGEINGLLSYDRAVLKVDRSRAAAANRGRFPTQRVVLPTSEDEGQTYRYTFSSPGNNWHKPDFDDSSWQSGPGGFGTPETPGSVVHTRWDTREIWLRRPFQWQGDPPRDLVFRLHHDEDVEIYLNGVHAASIRGYTTSYRQTFPLPTEAVDALQAGRNVLALRCKQTGGGQYIDLGIVELVFDEQDESAGSGN